VTPSPSRFPSVRGLFRRRSRAGDEAMSPGALGSPGTPDSAAGTPPAGRPAESKLSKQGSASASKRGLAQPVDRPRLDRPVHISSEVQKAAALARELMAADTELEEVAARSLALHEDGVIRWDPRPTHTHTLHEGA
jgi:hypothetical protein